MLPCLPFDFKQFTTTNSHRSRTRFKIPQPGNKQWCRSRRTKASNEIIFAEQKIGAVGHKEIRTDNTTPSGGQCLLEANVDGRVRRVRTNTAEKGLNSLSAGARRWRCRSQTSLIALSETGALHLFSKICLRWMDGFAEAKKKNIWNEVAALWAPENQEEREERSFSAHSDPHKRLVRSVFVCSHVHLTHTHTHVPVRGSDLHRWPACRIPSTS